MIGLIKKQLWKTFEGKKLTHEETLTVLAEASRRSTAGLSHGIQGRKGNHYVSRI
jgi:hypothetical protein